MGMQNRMTPRVELEQCIRSSRASGRYPELVRMGSKVVEVLLREQGTSQTHWLHWYTLGCPWVSDTTVQPHRVVFQCQDGDSWHTKIGAE